MPRPEPGAAPTSEADLSLADTLRGHWPEYAVEAGFLAVFVLGAGLVSAWLEGPAAAVASDLAARRLLAGVAMGLAIAAMIYSPWGRRSGSHLNPAITLAYLRLGKIGRWDALFYWTAQVMGAAVAVAILRAGVPGLLPVAMPSATLSASIGPTDDGTRFTTELVLSASAMLMILFTSNHTRWFRWTGWLFAALIALVVACGGPLSGFGMNLARLLAVDASDRANADWFNLLPPLLGMLLAVEAYRLFTGRSQVLCAKLAHNTHGKCIFRCQHPYRTRALALDAIRRRAAGSRR